MKPFPVVSLKFSVCNSPPVARNEYVHVFVSNTICIASVTDFSECSVNVL